MPPRHAYWTILIDGEPTAFRAAESDELLPTLNRLKQKHADTVMKWFERGRIWESRDEARQALGGGYQVWSGGKLAPPRRPRGAPAGSGGARQEGGPARESRDRGWRPGGDHRDPREKYAVAKKAKWQRFKDKIRGRHDRREEAPRSAQARGPATPRPDRPFRDDRDRPFAPRPDRRDARRDDGRRDDRPRDDRPRDDRDRPFQPRPDRRDTRRDDWRRDDRPHDDRDRPFAPRPDRDSRPGERRDDRPRDARVRDERPRPDRFRDDRPSGDRPWQPKARENRPFEKRPWSGRPRENRPPDQRFRDERPWDRPRDQRPRDDRSREQSFRNDRPRPDRPREDRSRDDRARDNRPKGPGAGRDRDRRFDTPGGPKPRFDKPGGPKPRTSGSWDRRDDRRPQGKFGGKPHGAGARRDAKGPRKPAKPRGGR